MEQPVVSMITTVLADVSTVVSSAVTTITGNAVGAVFIGMGVVGAAIGLVRRFMR